MLREIADEKLDYDTNRQTKTYGGEF